MNTNMAPVIVFGYNRADHLARTLETLSQATGANQTALWLFCDGPKPGNPVEPNEAMRRVAQDLRWQGSFASVTVQVSETNKGLARSIIGGVSEVLRGHDRVIVLEDDLLVSHDFLTYMNACLEFYRDNMRIGSISGFCPLSEPPRGYPHDVMAVPRNCSHGWAIWGDRWAEIDWTAADAVRLFRDRSLGRRMNAAGSDQLFRLYRQLKGRIDSWAVILSVWQVLTDRLTIYPVQNRVRNIGFDGSGTHTRAGEEMNSQIREDLVLPRLAHVDEDPTVLSAFRRVYSGKLHKRALRPLRLALNRAIWG